MCIVRDVPEARGYWYRGHSASSHLASSQSFEQPPIPSTSGQQPSSIQSKPQTQPQTQTQPSQQIQTQQQGQTKPGLAGVGSSKPSFSALFAKHPAIKEEPTTPGGSLLSETPPPTSTSPLASGASSTTKRSPFSRQQASELDQRKSGSGTIQPQLSADQMNRIESLFSELKRELKDEIAQLTGVGIGGSSRKRDVPADSSYLQQQGSEEKAKKAPSDISTTKSATIKQGPSSGTIGSTKASEVVDSTKSSSQKLLPTPPHHGTGDSSGESGTRDRERSKSPHRSTSSSDHGRHHQHRHRHHHHHHHKADHLTPQPTPESSQSDLRQESQLRERRRGSSSIRGSSDTVGAEKESHRAISIDQSDDDQDATSKL